MLAGCWRSLCERMLRRFEAGLLSRTAAAAVPRVAAPAVLPRVSRVPAVPAGVTAPVAAAQVRWNASFGSAHGQDGKGRGGSYYATGNAKDYAQRHLFGKMGTPHLDQTLDQGEAAMGILIKPESTLHDLWGQAQRVHATKRFVGAKMWVRGQIGYIWATFESLQREIDGCRHLLHSMGVRKGARVGVVSENRYEWIIAHVATLQLGAHLVVIPTNVTPTEARTIIQATQCRVLFVESEASAVAVKEWLGNLGELHPLICFDDQESEFSYAVASSIADSVEAKEPPLPNGEIKSDDTAMIMFTAGTTGPPKGVLLSHRCLVANISSVYAQLGESFTENDLFMSLCPWCVAGALTVELWQVILKGAMMLIPPELIEGFTDLRKFHPSVLVSVAMPFVRAYNNIVDEIMTMGFARRYMTKVAIGQITSARMALSQPGWLNGMFSDALLTKFKEPFGSELRVAIIIGQQLSVDMGELYADLDIFVVNTYGCMEAGGILATDLDVPGRLKALPGVELRVVNENNEVVVPGDIGEILVEAPHCMQGYFDIHVDPDEAQTAVVAYGTRTFCRTGDYGAVTGPWVQIHGHKDVLMTLDDGKVLDPLEIEQLLTKSPFIKQAFVFGDRRSYVVALVVPLPLAISNHLRKAERRDGMPIVNEKEKAEAVRLELRRITDKLLTPRAHVRRFCFVDEFTLDNGFLTNKGGYARQKIERHYAHYINQLYDEDVQFFGHAVDDYDDLY